MVTKSFTNIFAFKYKRTQLQQYFRTFISKAFREDRLEQ